MGKLPPVPAQLDAIVEALGVDDTVEFLLAFGGAELYVSKRPRVTSPVAQKFGLQKAQALGKVADRLPRRIPVQKLWLAQWFQSKGLSVAEIARKLHVTDVTVRKYLGDVPRRDPIQPGLFD